MEAWGRGIPDIFNECRAAGLPAPEFESIPNFVCLTIRFKNPLRPYLTGGGDNDRINDKGFIVHEGSRKTGGYRVK